MCSRSCERCERCERCDNSFFKKACLVKTHVKYWVCKGAKRPKIGGDDNFPGGGGDGYFGL